MRRNVFWGILVAMAVGTTMPTGVFAQDAAEDLSAVYEKEVYDYKVIRNLPTWYEESGWSAYCSAAGNLLRLDPENLTEEAAGLIEAVTAAKENLTEVIDEEDARWYIWGEDMPIEDESNLTFGISSEDNEDFKPFLVPYLVENQNEAKGNLIVISGGGYESRANTQEGYPVAKKMKELGYNCYVLQRRVAPYSVNDVWADLQRSIRYLRFNSESLGLGGMNCMAAVGFSGGSGTVLGTVAGFYGDIQPTIYDEDYQPDEIDAVNSDLDVAISVYGPKYDYSVETYEGLITENPNLPAMLIIAGEEDEYGTAVDNLELYRSVEDKTIAEMYTFAQNPHGFGPGMAGTNSVRWTELASDFMQQAIIARNDNSIEVGENAQYGVIPEGYTKYQMYKTAMPFGEVEVTLAETEDGHNYIIFFEAFGEEQIITGNVLEDCVLPKYDRTGFFASDSQTLYNGHDENAWLTVE